MDRNQVDYACAVHRHRKAVAWHGYLGERCVIALAVVFVCIWIAGVL